MLRYPATQGQRDINEFEIIAALKSAGATVEPLTTGRIPDLLVGFREVNYLMEVKQQPVKGKVFASHCKLNKVQEEWHSTWQGQKAIVRTPEEALEVIGL